MGLRRGRLVLRNWLGGVLDGVAEWTELGKGYMTKKFIDVKGRKRQAILDGIMMMNGIRLLNTIPAIHLNQIESKTIYVIRSSSTGRSSSNL